MKPDLLKRYTSLPVLLDILSNKKLTLLDPKSWEDQNDSYYLNLYKEKLGLKSVLALCFTEAPETFHHWKVFSGNSSAVGIHFYKEELLKKINGNSGIKSDYVIYKLLNEARTTPPTISELPFVKRHAFKDEVEFRLIYESKTEEIAGKDVKINIKSIERITLGPWIPKPVFQSVKSVINNIKGCSQIKVFRTTIVDNRQWKNIGKKVA